VNHWFLLFGIMVSIFAGLDWHRKFWGMFIMDLLLLVFDTFMFIVG